MPKAKEVTTATPGQAKKRAPPSTPQRKGDQSLSSEDVSKKAVTEESKSPEGHSSSTKLKNREEFEKAYHSLYKHGASMLEIVWNENRSLKKQLDAHHQQQSEGVKEIAKELPELTDLVKELRQMRIQPQAADPKLSTAISTLTEVQKQTHEESKKAFDDWQKDIAMRINNLLQMKTPCALTKVDLINTVRKEYAAFSQRQELRHNERPAVATNEDMQKTLASFEDMRMNLIRLENKLGEVAGQVQQLCAESRSSSSSSSGANSRQSSPRRERGSEATRQESTRPKDSDSRQQIDSTSVVDRSPRTNPPTSRKETTPPKTAQDSLVQELHDIEERIRTINRQLEIELALNTDDSRKREKDLRREKKLLMKQKDSIALRLKDRRGRNEARRQVDTYRTGGRSNSRSRSRPRGSAQGQSRNWEGARTREEATGYQRNRSGSWSRTHDQSARRATYGWGV
ncbi:unnamed protein product [Nippostrongylus brasiliensis]|uniref:CCHC-type domain-containing protein n=1 Tax=Nippostrongylus brasiliensis TaxID=27835 RepID=A0A0N4YE66_NIPBR|nr:unnamed protein product [Nippostrongylus brasiliensis]